MLCLEKKVNAYNLGRDNNTFPGAGESGALKRRARLVGGRFSADQVIGESEGGVESGGCVRLGARSTELKQENRGNNESEQLHVAISLW